ncbi:MAG: 50S ribosomal protein L29 [Desulfovibrionaceae bacterium]|jgi:large subunit ribosomal protein L29|nr:50S ribosomal protein L29 [Desulfovibrionaceae bacterium]
MAAKKNKNDSGRPTAADLTQLSVEELRTKLAEQQQEVFTLRMQHATAQLENTAGLKAAKRQVARIMTVLNEKG